ncbi:MAG: archaetidylserine decarboxylase [Thiotrichales bacterium]|nr:archaetidylserine decarboxylase [Thiotrichales bacterium]
MKQAHVDKLKVWPQYLLPQHSLSRLVHFLARIEHEAWKNFLISQFIRVFRVDMTEAEDPDPGSYASFNNFFARALQADARPLAGDTAAIISPVDGYLSEFGTITNNTLLQAKGRDYSLDSLLAGNPALAARFSAGRYATLYLSPKNYHRIHMPYGGRLDQMIYVPGRLFAVNQPTVGQVDQLFSRNERAITVFSTPIGNMAIIMVGAIFVGNIETVWAGEINSPYPKEIRTDLYQSLARPITLERGAEMGRFNMGSTVILLFEDGAMEWDDGLSQGQAIRMGQKLGIMNRKMQGGI